MSYIRNSNNTYDKCQKILQMFSQIDHSSAAKNPPIRPAFSSKTPYYLSKSTTKKSSNLHNNSASGSRSALKTNLNLTNQYQSTTLKKDTKDSSLFRQKSNSSFISCYKKESRLQQIMKLKVSKPKIYSMAGLNSHKKAILLNTSFSSLNSSRSSLNKQNVSRNCNKESRLQKIMNIKVEKPKVNSTLLGYEPKKCERSASKSLTKKNSFLAQNNTIVELKQMKKKVRKSHQVQQKQQRLWKIFEREREQQLKDKKRQEEENYKKNRRNEEKFQKMVQKELKKIQNSRQISLRKERTFSPYLYPSY